jgi:hypothetical protein
MADDVADADAAAKELLVKMEAGKKVKEDEEAKKTEDNPEDDDVSFIS